jgi:LmbE family N-acetylglucosaminyl deacetylase
VPERRRALLAVHAHPDDETVTMGGTLARYSAAGTRTILVTCTTGDLGAAASVRALELEAAARVLGIARVVQLGYADSGMAGEAANTRPGAFFVADVEQVSRRVVAILEEERPQVLVTYDETGGYGHPDHIKARQVAVAAFCACPVEIRPKKLYSIRFPLGWSREFVQSLRQSGIDAPGSAPTGADAGPDVAEIGAPDHLVTTSIDVRAYISTKLAAIACHPSQWPPEHFLRRIPQELAERLWAYEFFSVEDGSSTIRKNETDLFEGIE